MSANWNPPDGQTCISVRGMAIRAPCRDFSDSNQIEIGLSGAHAAALVNRTCHDKLHPEKPQALQDVKVSWKGSYRLGGSQVEVTQT